MFNFGEQFAMYADKDNAGYRAANKPARWVNQARGEYQIAGGETRTVGRASASQLRGARARASRRAR